LNRIKLLSLCFLISSLAAHAQLLKWERVFGGPAYEYGEYVIQCADKGYLVAGSTSSYTANTDAYLLKVDSNGTFLWHRIFGGGNVEWAKSVKEIPSDSGFIFCGYTNSMGNGGYDVYLVRTDKNANILWQKTYGGADWDFGNSVSLASDGGFILCGSTFSFGNGNEDVYVIKTDAMGVLQWDTTYGGMDDEQANEIHQTNDGGYIIAAQTKSYGAGNYDAWIIKLNANADTVWTDVNGGADEDVLMSVQEMTNGNYITAGHITTLNGDLDSYLAQYDNLGTQQWSRDFAIPNNQNIKSIRETYNGGFFTIGNTNNGGGGGEDINFLLLSNAGWYVDGGTRGGQNNEFGYHGEQCADSGFIVIGTTRSWGNGLTDMFLIKFDKNLLFTQLPVVGIYEESNAHNSTNIVYPNPSNEKATILLAIAQKNVSIKLYSVLGNEILDFNFEWKQSQILEIYTSTLPDGVYFLKSSNGLINEKIIVKH
jgi:hypothetical protein